MMAMMTGHQAERADQMDEQSVKAMVISTIEKIRPAAKGKLKAAGFKSWFRDPFASGDWTNFGPGQVTRFAGKMNAPHGRIHLCGDATALSARGMEGALESAERAAVEIFDVIF
jgi:monoamine oxidase